MFIHNFKYALKTLFRSKMLIFWTFAFPIILGTFFNLAFSDIEKSETFDAVNIAIIENEYFKENEFIKEAFKNISDQKDEDRIFNIKYTNEEEAKKLLEEDEVVGYMLLDKDTPKLTFKSNGTNETIFKYAVEEILQTQKIVNAKAQENVEKEIKSGNFNVDYEKIYKEILEKVQNQTANIKDVTSNNLSYTMIEFYTLIAMTCLYGGLLGMVAINKNLANMSNNGKRVSVAPTSKGKVILSSLLAGYITQIVGVALLFIYTIFVLKVDYGSNLPLVILLCLVGSLAGLSMGTAIGTVFKASENTKTGIVIAVTMFGCFFSGMMGITMKYIVDKNAPIVNIINPANMITDGLYSLYYYSTFDRYIFNMVSLAIFSIIMIGISYISLRRQKYDSI